MRLILAVAHGAFDVGSWAREPAAVVEGVEAARRHRVTRLGARLRVATGESVSMADNNATH